ncbi:P-loop containing nucleoside triphosphate hydrolase superfamily protein [Trifolium repens]|nr:P-loop containing nucleoside triphosphate hydrolase superfamily protein [Trifolium repens]
MIFLAAHSLHDSTDRTFVNISQLDDFKNNFLLFVIQQLDDFFVDDVRCCSKSIGVAPPFTVAPPKADSSSCSTCTPPTIGQATTPPCLEEEDHLQDVEGEGIRGMLLERSSCTLLVEGVAVFDIKEIGFVIQDYQILYWSATWPKEVEQLESQLLDNPYKVRFTLLGSCYALLFDIILLLKCHPFLAAIRAVPTQPLKSLFNG